VFFPSLVCGVWSVVLSRSTAAARPVSRHSAVYSRPQEVSRRPQDVDLTSHVLEWWMKHLPSLSRPSLPVCVDDDGDVDNNNNDDDDVRICIAP